MKAPASPLGRVLFLLSRKLLQQPKAKSLSSRTPLRESMIELHREWYETEDAWRNFLTAVRSRKPAAIHDKLLDAAIAMLNLAATTYQGPLTYEAATEPENLQALLRESDCQQCGHPGDVMAILPHPKSPQWKLECVECGATWITGGTPQATFPLTPLTQPDPDSAQDD